MKKTTPPPLKLYLSQSAIALDRKGTIFRFLRNEKLVFEEVNPEYSTSFLPHNNLKSDIRKHMEKADYYLVVADRYETLEQWISVEMVCAFFLDVPIIVLQPWTCWSIPQKLKENATVIINLDQRALIDFLKRPTDKQRWLSAS